LVLLSSSSCSNLEPRSTHDCTILLFEMPAHAFPFRKRPIQPLCAVPQSLRIIESGLKKQKQKTKKWKKRVIFLFYSAEEGSKKEKVCVCLFNHCGRACVGVCVQPGLPLIKRPCAAITHHPWHRGTCAQPWESARCGRGSLGNEPCYSCPL
jgi:hypothetical protein